jgi:hypothetical protein
MQVSNPAPRFASLSELEARRAACETFQAEQKQATIDRTLATLDTKLFSKVAITGTPSKIPDLSYKSLLSGINDLLTQSAINGWKKVGGIKFKEISAYFATDKPAKNELTKAMKALRGNRLLSYGWFRKVRLTELGEAAIKRFNAPPAAPVAAPPAATGPAPTPSAPTAPITASSTAVSPSPVTTPAAPSPAPAGTPSVTP